MTKLWTWVLNAFFELDFFFAFWNSVDHHIIVPLDSRIV